MRNSYITLGDPSVDRFLELWVLRIVHSDHNARPVLPGSCLSPARVVGGGQ